MRFLGISRISWDFTRFPQISEGFCGISEGFHRISKGFLGTSEGFHGISKGLPRFNVYYAGIGMMLTAHISNFLISLITRSFCEPIIVARCQVSDFNSKLLQSSGGL